MSGLLKTGPIVWIPSRIWFPFLSRRLQALYESHGKLWDEWPNNYGVISGLLAFLMQSVIFTPPKVNSYVRESLAALNYKNNCERFGMFFIPMEDPDRPWLIDGVAEVETKEVAHELRLNLRRPRTRRRERVQEEEEDGDGTRYPLGEAPTWKQIAASLQGDPTILIPRWEDPLVENVAYSESEPGSIERQAVELFIKFTCHVWISLNLTWRTRPENRINPITVGAALRCWSVDAILDAVLETSFKPCHSGEGGPGRPSMSFSERRRMYFHHDDHQSLAKVWRQFGDRPGYVYEYHERQGYLDADGRRALDSCLEDLLMQCQCLPDSSRSKSGNWLWRVDKKKIVILTNPKFFRVKRIGQIVSSRKGQGPRAAPAHRSARSTAIAMMVQEDYPEEVAEKAYNAVQRHKGNRKRQSTKSRNRRKPPKRRQFVESEAEESDDDVDADDEDDEREEDEEDEPQLDSDFEVWEV